MPPGTDWINYLNGLLLLLLAVRAGWGWVFGREYADQDHAKELARHSQEIDRQRDRTHDIAAVASRQQLAIAVLEERMASLERRADSLEDWRHG